MTLFTAGGLLRARQRGGDVPGALWQAYQRWLATQRDRGFAGADGWLIGQEFLHDQRAAGVTCLSALEGGWPGRAAQPVNNSKGCGSVMRVAPVGLAGGNPFTIGGQAAALTHGHSSGYLAAAAFALMISHLADGGTRPDGLEGRDVITQVADDLYDVFAEGASHRRSGIPVKPRW